jgi:predicted lipoprotein with Yx(FWY)xxD motif/predicted outer membrane protein
MRVRSRGWRPIVLLVASGVAVALTGCSPNTINAANGYQGQDYGANLPNGRDNPPRNSEVAATLTANPSATAGLVTIDNEGYTLYRYERDMPNPPMANCLGDCAKRWPPARPPEGEITTKGISRRLVNKIKRRDGTWQLTLNGWPLYRFSGDRRPGDATGQQLDSVWFAAGPSGDRAQPSNVPITANGYWQTKWGPLSPMDRSLLIAVRLAGLWEQPAGTTAVERGGSARVRQVGGEIARQHIQLDRDVRNVAAQLGVPLPNQMTAQQKQWVSEMLRAPTGAQFDQIFVNRLRFAHGGIYPAIGAVRGATQNTLVRAHAQRAERFVNTHMSLLESTGLVGADDLPPAPPAAPPPAPK